MNTTQPTAQLDTTTSDVVAIANLTRQTFPTHSLELGEFHIVHGGDGQVHQIDLTTDDYRDSPNHIQARVNLTDVDSLLAYWDKHHDTSSEVYADRQAHTITAILDAHHGMKAEDESERDEFDRARWQHHRATLALSTSDPWREWTGHDGKAMSQDQFAEFIEDHMPYIVDPVAAELVEMAQTFQATTSANFKSGFKLQNGQRVLQYVETIDASMRDGETAVPTQLTLRLPIWRGAQEAIDLTARIRYRVGGGKLSLGYKLDRPTEAIDAAFEQEIARVTEHIARPVLRGTPASA